MAKYTTYKRERRGQGADAGAQGGASQQVHDERAGGDPVTTYVATISRPGCLPDSDGEPQTFDTVREAWDHLADELAYWQLAYWDADSEEAQDGIAEVLVAMGEAGEAGVLGTIYGPTPGYDGAHDLGLAWTVDIL